MQARLGKLFRFLFPSDISTDWQRQREPWVRDVTGLMAIVLLVAAAIIACGTLAGFFVFQDTLPIYILLILIGPAWWGTRHGGWKWAGYFPALLCFSLGIYSSIQSGFATIFVLYYALSVLLAGMLLSYRMGLLMVLFSTLAYAGLSMRTDGFSFDALASIITFFFGLVGIALLQWYTQTHFQKMLKAQAESNQQLKAEMTRRQQAELAQQDQETQLRRLAENMTDMVTEIDPNGIMLYVSPSYQSSLGYAPEALLGTNAFDLVHPDDRPAANEKAREVAVSRNPDRIPLRVLHADGHIIFVEISGRPLYDQHAELTGFVLASRDITLQKQAENAIQESEKKFRNIIELLPLGIHMYSLQEDDSLVFSGYNSAADSILGIEHAKILGQPLESAFPGLAATEIPARYRAIARLGDSWHQVQVDYAHQPIQGAYEVHAFQTSPGKMVAVFADVTERIRAAEALRLSEEKFATAFLTSPDSVNINRLVDGVYIDINQGFTRLMGYTREEVLGKSSLELNIWADPADRARLVKALLENGEVENLEAGFRRKNGSLTIALMSARVIVIQGEKCILSITRDISERIQSELELREANAMLEQAYEATLQGWARALELRERETADHSRRVVEHAVRIARLMGIEGKDLVHLRRGALLHDIGKMGVPDEILLKPGRLTPDEWVTMRQHADFARSMLNDIDYLRPCIDIPYYHHEKWDGTGYPQGLAGEAIPLAARIFAVADVFDALTHDRPYRPAWSKADARHYLVEQSGQHFDPHMVEIFLSIL